VYPPDQYLERTCISSLSSALCFWTLGINLSCPVTSVPGIGPGQGSLTLRLTPSGSVESICFMTYLLLCWSMELRNYTHLYGKAHCQVCWWFCEKLNIRQVLKSSFYFFNGYFVVIFKKLPPSPKSRKTELRSILQVHWSLPSQAYRGGFWWKGWALSLKGFWGSPELSLSSVTKIKKWSQDIVGRCGNRFCRWLTSSLISRNTFIVWGTLARVI
jgi:hypothetical protein